MKRRSRVLFSIFGVCFFLYLGWHLTMQLGLGLPGYADFYLHRGRYQDIVTSAKSLNLSPGHEAEHSLAGLPTWINNDKSGRYTITIVTKNWGHAGKYGYVYSDESCSAIPVDDVPSEKTLPVSCRLPLFVTGRINAHWWVAHNPLD